MASHAYIQSEDLGLTILGTTQTSYTVDGVHGQDYDTAVYRAALCRATAIEEVVTSYVALEKKRQDKLDKLGEALAKVNEAVAATDDPETSTVITIGGSVASTLQNYGFDATARMTYKALQTLIQDVKYAIDKEDNAIQQDMTELEGFVSKRDDTMQMATKLMKKVATTRQRGINYIGS